MFRYPHRSTPAPRTIAVEQAAAARRPPTTRRAPRATTASPFTGRRAGKDRDDRQEHGRADQGEERRRRRVHPVATSRSSRIYWVSDMSLRLAEEDLERQPAAGGVRVGQGREHQVHQRRRQDAVRDADQAGQLRSVEEVSDDGLHLRGAVAGTAQLSRAQRRHQHQHHALREQRLRRAAARHRLRDRLSRTERDEVRDSGDSTPWSRRATSIRSASGSRATRGAGTRSPT